MEMHHPHATTRPAVHDPYLHVLSNTDDEDSDNSEYSEPSEEGIQLTRRKWTEDEKRQLEQLVKQNG